MNGLRPVAESWQLILPFGFRCHCQSCSKKYIICLADKWSASRLPCARWRRPSVGPPTATPDAIFAHFPGLKVVSPGTPYDAKGLLKSAIRTRWPGDVYRTSYTVSTAWEVPEEEYTVPIGVSDVKRAGSDITIVAYAKRFAGGSRCCRKISSGRHWCWVIDLRSFTAVRRDQYSTLFQKRSKL